MEMTMEQFLEQIDVHDPDVLRRLPSSLVAKVRPDLFWTCANCLCKQPSAEYRRLVVDSPSESEEDGAGAEGTAEGAGGTESEGGAASAGGGAAGSAQDEAAASADGGAAAASAEETRCGSCGAPRLAPAADDGPEPDLAALFTMPRLPGSDEMLCMPARAPTAHPGGTAVCYDARMLAHFKPERETVHPERPDRLRAIRQHLSATGLWERCNPLEARRATPEELHLVHTPEHCRVVQEHCLASKDFRSDTYAVEASWEAALLSCGAVVEMSLAVARGDQRNGFALVRPPGHHAEPPHPMLSANALAPPRGAEHLVGTPHMPWAASCCGSMGFCLFNNVAVAARAAQRAVPSCKRVLIVDWDVHHGNGTQTPFFDDPSVLYFSAHMYNDGQFYPGGPAGGPRQVGIGAGEGFNVNIGWNEGGMGDAEYAAAWFRVLLPIATSFQPDLILVSAGFDAAMDDPLGGCEISPGGYALMTQLLMGLAGGKVVLALEGGYNLRSISRSAAACVGALLGDPPPPLVLRPQQFSGSDDEDDGPEAAGPARGAAKAIRRTAQALAPYWPSLCVRLPQPEPPQQLQPDPEAEHGGSLAGAAGDSSSSSSGEEGGGAEGGEERRDEFAMADAADEAEDLRGEEDLRGGGDGEEEEQEDEDEEEHIVVQSSKRARVEVEGGE